MTQISYPWDGTATGDAGPYTDDQWSTLWEEYFRNEIQTDRNALGYLPGTESSGNTPLEITETSPTSLAVNVEQGSFIFFGRIYNNDARETLSITQNLSGSNRIDSIVLECDWTAQTVRLAVVEGTPAGSPVAPTLTQTKGTLWQQKLADITVANGAGSITNANIDTSANLPLQRVNNMIQTVAVETARSDFNDEWANQEQQTSPIQIVNHPSGKGFFMSTDDGSNWYKSGLNIESVSYDGSYTTSSATWADVDSSNLTLDIDLTGGVLLIGWAMSATSNRVSGQAQGGISFFLTGSTVSQRVTNGSAISDDSKDAGYVNAVDGLAINNGSTARYLQGIIIVTGLAAETVTIDLQFAYDGAGGNTFELSGPSTNSDFSNISFWAMEI
jgi:hypothetical protein